MHFRQTSNAAFQSLIAWCMSSFVCPLFQPLYDWIAIELQSCVDLVLGLPRNNRRYSLGEIFLARWWQLVEYGLVESVEVDQFAL